MALLQAPTPGYSLRTLTDMGWRAEPFDARPSGEHADLVRRLSDRAPAGACRVSPLYAPHECPECGFPLYGPHDTACSQNTDPEVLAERELDAHMNYVSDQAMRRGDRIEWALCAAEDRGNG